VWGYQKLYFPAAMKNPQNADESSTDGNETRVAAVESNDVADQSDQNPPAFETKPSAFSATSNDMQEDHSGLPDEATRVRGSEEGKDEKLHQHSTDRSARAELPPSAEHKPPNVQEAAAHPGAVAVAGMEGEESDGETVNETELPGQDLPHTATGNAQSRTILTQIENSSNLDIGGLDMHTGLSHSNEPMTDPEVEAETYSMVVAELP